MRKIFSCAVLIVLTFCARESAVRPDLVAWARQHAIPLQTTNPGAPIDDLAWLHPLASRSRVIGMGEATHGTREFFQMKHRLVRYLVEREGFTTFAIEANLPEAEAINEYVLNGTGDPARALAGLHFWTWDTYEVRDLIEWMRLWNADDRHRKVKFYGFDCQFSGFAARAVLRYLDRVQPSAARELQSSLLFLSADPPPGTTVTKARSGELSAQLAALSRLFDSHRLTWSQHGGDAEWQLTTQYVTVLRQATSLRAGGPSRRDGYMADNVKWILTREPGKVALWAHNGHVAWTAGSMGSYLRSTLGASYAVIGFAFGRGQFRARPTNDLSSGVVEITVSPRGGGVFDQSLARVGLPLFALETRNAPSDLDRPISMREFGAVFFPRLPFTRMPFREFDVIIFVRDTTAARPTPTGVRTSGR